MTQFDEPFEEPLGPNQFDWTLDGNGSSLPYDQNELVDGLGDTTFLQKAQNGINNLKTEITDELENGAIGFATSGAYELGRYDEAAGKPWRHTPVFTVLGIAIVGFLTLGWVSQYFTNNAKDAFDTATTIIKDDLPELQESFDTQTASVADNTANEAFFDISAPSKAIATAQAMEDHTHQINNGKVKYIEFDGHPASNMVGGIDLKFEFEKGAGNSHGRIYVHAQAKGSYGDISNDGVTTVKFNQTDVKGRGKLLRYNHKGLSDEFYAFSIPGCASCGYIEVHVREKDNRELVVNLERRDYTQ